VIGSAPCHSIGFGQGFLHDGRTGQKPATNFHHVGRRKQIFYDFEVGMTTLFKEEESCFVCGRSSEHTVLGSTNAFGSPDLDLRPPPMKRSTIRHWVQRCPFCGYCAASISEGPEIAKRIVTSSDYVEQLAAPAFPALANHFLCWSLIQTADGEDAGAAMAALHAAWTCDDERATAKADVCRQKAIAQFTNARAKGQQYAEDSAAEALLLADLYRRTGQFEQVEAICEEELARQPGELMTSLFSAQRQLAQSRDSRGHTVEEALKLQRATS
jgi:hypothetical protein